MNTESITNRVIPQKLAEIEHRENVRILHCVESGSRAWGFSSPDSDYDVRFIYVRTRSDYLRLDGMRDVIEWQLDDTLDINGWDLQKMLRLPLDLGAEHPSAHAVLGTDRCVFGSRSHPGGARPSAPQDGDSRTWRGAARGHHQPLCGGIHCRTGSDPYDPSCG